MEAILKQAESVLSNAGQKHILEQWPKRTPQEQEKMARQVLDLDRSYPGGIKEYIRRAQILLKDAKEGANPYDDYTPSVPTGETLSFDDPEYEKFEDLGLQEMKYTGFVLVAGGLGERLGYSSIKIAIPPTSIVPEMTFLKYYIDNLKALEDRIKPTLPEAERAKFYIPLCIMTSDDTHKGTLELLEKNKHYGKPADQITIVKQEKVPALMGIDGTFALEKNFEIMTKPHGHGDVHTLLHQFGVAKKWKNELGKKWAVFFQDTNPMTFKSLLPLVAVSAKHDFDMNTATVPRKPGEAMGAICKMTNDKTKESLTINVEYNQLDSVLKAKYKKEGDVPEKDGYSPFPGNINVLVFKLSTYLSALEKTKGCVPEFVNPKYADSTKTVFKTPTRLECMMQEFPKLFEQGAKVGFTRCDRWLCFSPVKNNLTDAATKSKQGLPPESASSCEYDFFYGNIRFLQRVGVDVEMPAKDEFHEYQGIKLPAYPKIILMPSFAITLKELKSKVKGKWHISKKSTIVLEGMKTEVKNLNVDGSVWIDGPKDEVKINDKKYVEFVKLGDKEPEYLKIRGYKPSTLEIQHIH